MWSSDPLPSCAFGSCLPYVFYNSTLIHVNVVSKCRPARALEVMGYSRSQVSDFHFSVTLQEALDENDMTTTHCNEKLIAYLKAKVL